MEHTTILILVASLR